jgi:hypothetical protein
MVFIVDVVKCFIRKRARINGRCVLAVLCKCFQHKFLRGLELHGGIQYIAEVSIVVEIFSTGASYAEEKPLVCNLA